MFEGQNYYSRSQNENYYAKWSVQPQSGAFSNYVARSSLSVCGVITDSRKYSVINVWK